MEKELSRQPSFRESSHPAPSTTRHPAFAMVFVELGGIKENVLASMTPIHGALSAPYQDSHLLEKAFIQRPAQLVIQHLRWHL
ncbi:hypothetical protein SJR95_11840 [Aeromonas caviae]|uniref:hypothetical protein n=1 Tax=Aeromonas caviae TaxID=648 RepID=UPI0029D6CC8D|nr:hypothetical protein [Aeromonas caviae]MDX7860724.1 hypothetical protein [Aeromonas caviae]